MKNETFDIATSISKRANIPTRKPTNDEESYITDGKSFMIMRAAFWAHYLYNEMKVVYTDKVPYAATDGHYNFVNPKGLKDADMGPAEVCFVLAHEVCHGFLGDLLKMIVYKRDGFVRTPIGDLPYDAKLMNAAEDYRINAMLKAGKVGKMPKMGLYDPKYSKEGLESAVEVYVKLWQDGVRGDDFGDGAGGTGGFDIHLEPSDEAIEADESGQRAQAICAAAAQHEASGQGTLPAAIRTLLGEILDPKVPWEEFLKATMMRKAGDPVYDWRYLDKRLLSRPDQMIFARQGHTGAGLIVVGYDTSGSCVNPEVQRRFFSEMAGITAALNPSALMVIWCDAAVQRVDEVEEPEDLEDLRAEINALGGAPGGGGTDFRPVFREIEQRGLEPDMVVYLTDTYGTFPEQEPSYPVIWCSIVSGTTVPWGDFVEVEL